MTENVVVIDRANTVDLWAEELNIKALQRTHAIRFPWSPDWCSADAGMVRLWLQMGRPLSEVAIIRETQVEAVKRPCSDCGIESCDSILLKFADGRIFAAFSAIELVAMLHISGEPEIHTDITQEEFDFAINMAGIKVVDRFSNDD